MRVKMSRLRRIVREALATGTIAEAPFMDILPAFDAQAERGSPEAKMAHRSVDRFHRTPVFLKKATATFKDFPYDVYVLPITGDYDTEFTQNFGERITVIDASEGVDLLRGIGLDEDVVDRAEAAVSGGGTVILSVAEGMTPGQLPTPWMIVHAAFDANSRSFMQGAADDVRKMIIKTGIEGEDLIRAMTMGSARESKIESDSEGDIAAELITQAIVDSRGVHFNLDAVSVEDQASLAKIKSFIDALSVKENFHNAVRRKFILLKTAFGD